MQIGELAAQSGVSRDTIRFYEKMNLLAATSRDAQSDYKYYDAGALRRLLQIRHLKSMGFTLREIGRLLVNREGGHPCEGLPKGIAQKVEHIDAQIAALVQFRSSLTQMQHACDGQCNTGTGIPSCVPDVAKRAVSASCCSLGRV